MSERGWLEHELGIERERREAAEALLVKERRRLIDHGAMLVGIEAERFERASAWAARWKHAAKEFRRLASILEFEDSELLDAQAKRIATLEARFRVARPIPMLLHCPECSRRHIDVGDFATKLHHTHACQGCGHTWRPAVEPTCGVQFLPGFKNEPGEAETERAAVVAYLRDQAQGLCDMKQADRIEHGEHRKRGA